MLLVILVLSIFSTNIIFAANPKLKDKGIKISNSDLVPISFNANNRTARIYNKTADDLRKENPSLPITDEMVYSSLDLCTFDNNHDPDHLEELGCYALRHPNDAEIIQIFYKNAIKIDDKDIDVNFEFQLVEGADVPDEYYPQFNNNNQNRIGKYSNGQVVLFNHGGKVRVKISFVQNNQPYKFTGAFGFRDPDHGDILFNTTNRKLYYVDAPVSGFGDGLDNSSITNTALSSTTYASHTEVTSNGIIHPLESSTHLGGLETVGYSEAIIAINLLNESDFEFYLDSYWNDGDWTIYPYLYNKITADEQVTAKARVVFKDQDDNNKILKTRATVEGTLGSKIVDSGYTTDLNNYLNDGYELVSNGMTNATYTQSSGVQDVVILLKHKKTESTESKTVSRTINYYKNNTSGEKLFNSVVQSQKFNRTKTTDLVTNQSTYDSWSPTNKTLEAVNNPTHEDWYTDDNNVATLTVSPSSTNTTVDIIYKQYQYATVVYIDETENNQVLEETSKMRGKQGANINYNAINRIKYYTDRGYELVRNEVATVKKYDSDSSKDQQFKVILKHTYTTVNKDNYEKDKCLNNACSAKQPKNGC